MRTAVRRCRSFVVGSFAAVALLGTTSAYADAIVWGNSASNGNVNLEAFSIADDGTVTLLQQFLVPNLIARNDNGRGVALLGDTIYYTTAGSGNIYVTNATTHADLGVLVSTGFAGIANVATDGVFIYANNYQDGSGVVNKYDTSGNLVGTVTVAPGTFGRDGFEVQNNPFLDSGNTTFISNRGDLTSPYDVYKADGTLLVSGFIDPSAKGFGNSQTGIAFDGTSYFVSMILQNALLQYDAQGNFVRQIDLSKIPNPFTGRLLEDLSALGNTVTNPPESTTTGSAPEPASLALLVIGGAAWARARQRKRDA